MKLNQLKILAAAFTTSFMVSCTQDIPVLLVIGGHSFDTTEFFDLFASLEGIDHKVAWHPEALDLLGSDQLNDFDVVVFYDFMTELPKEKSEIFDNLAREGKSLFFLHHALCGFQNWEGYGNIVGGSYVGPASGADSSRFSGYRHDIVLDIKIMDQDHPVTRNMEDFQIHDEGYTNLWLKQGLTPLLKTDHPDCDPLVGWTHEYENSTVLYILLGHDKQAYGNPSFKQILEQGINWLAEE